MQVQKNTNPIINKYWKSANELYSEGYHNSSEIQAGQAISRIKILQEMGNQMLLYYIKQHKQQAQNIYALQKQVVKNLSKELKIGNIPPNYILGFSIFQQINTNELFTHLFEQINEILGIKSKETSSKLEFDLSVDEADSSEEDFPNFYIQTKKKNSSQNHSFSDTFSSSVKIDLNQSAFFTEDLVLDLAEDEELNSDIFPNQNLEVKQYLNRLSKSTTQLSYLCQHMKWSQPISTDQRSQINNAIYSSIVSVTVRANNKAFSITGSCPGAISKKQARRIAALFVLRKIYNKFPDVWETFKRLREKNEGIQQALNANNEEIFKKANLDVLDVSFFKDEKKIQENDPLSKKINQYLDTLASFKNQINILIGRCKEISPPNLIREKQDQMGLWPVTATLNDGPQILKAQSKQTSKKKAEQKCSRELLELIYRKDVKRWYQFMEYKKVKNL